MNEPALIPRVTHDWITERQQRLPRMWGVPRRFDEYLRHARWWELEALRGYASSAESARYSRNMRWSAELAQLYGPGTWIELIKRSGHQSPEEQHRKRRRG